MYRTISIGNNILIQGQEERMAPDGRVVIRVGNQMVQGWPITPQAQPEPQDEALHNSAHHNPVRH